MAEVLIGLAVVGVCIHVLGAYIAVVDHYFGR
jgi:hypothetical protein